MVSRKEWYERTNAEWPQDVPALTGAEAVRAARKLYRFVKKQKCPYPVTLTSGRRHSWLYHGVLYVNPNAPHHGGGWRSLLHDLSHLLGGGHSKEHARLERRMVKEVVRRGWLSGALKDEPAPTPAAPADPRVVKYRAVVLRIDKWLAKKRRAERALAKLARARKYYERVGVAA